MNQFPHTTERIESIEAYVRPPWWEPSFETVIKDTKDTAKAHHDRTNAPIHQETHTTIYTDGSGINGKVGAAACNISAQHSRLQHLGGEDRYNVYAGELAALQLAAEMIQNDERKANAYRIYTDSQAAAKAIKRPRRQSGQSIIKEILDSFDALAREHPNVRISIVWIPGHSEIEGN